MKASSHARKDEVTEAQKLYQAVLVDFPKNIRAQQGLAALNNLKQNSSQEVVAQLVNLYNQGQFSAVVEQAQALTKQYPEALAVWNILGVSAAQIKMLDLAITAFQKVTSLKPNFADAYFNMGVALNDQGKIEEAIKAYNNALSLKPDFTEAYNNLGNALKDQGKLNEAIEAYNKALSIKPDFTEAYNNLGNALKGQDKLDEAIEAFNKAILLKPNYANAFNNMGNALKDQDKLNEAIEAYNKALSIKPDFTEAYKNLGNALKDQGKLDEAIEAFKNTLLLKPDYTDVYNNLGNTLKDQDKLDEAIEAFNKAILLKPNCEMAYNNMGIAFKYQGKLDEAIEAFKKAILLKPDYAKAYSNIGVILKDQGKLDEAIEAFDKSISLKPDYANTYSNKGATLQDQGKLDEAIEAYNKALSIKPDHADTHNNLSFTLLNSGRLKEGLDENEWRWKTSKFLSQERHFSQPLWDGKNSLNGKRILLWCEQGVGDTIMWSSCLSLVTSQAKHCILECQPKLVPLLKRSFPNIEVKAEDRNLDQQRDDFDFHLPMGSLYKNFIQKISTINKTDAYLVPDPNKVGYWRKRLKSLGNGPYIGISWKSADMDIKRLPNYATISELYPVLKLPDVIYVNLQYTDFANDLTKIKKELGVTIHNFDDLDHFNNIDDVAALCAALDMVVSTKTTVPLISAGVGKLTKLANWRQSPWNNILLNPFGPSVDIFERDTWEPWNNVFNLIAKDIFKITKTAISNG